MVGVAQLVESRIVIPVVVGSSPIVHPNIYSKSGGLPNNLLLETLSRAVSSVGRAGDS